MIKNVITLATLFLFLLSVATGAQEVNIYNQLDEAPYDPAVDSDADMFISHWNESMPRNVHGSLIMRDILTPLTTDDPMRPVARGAVATAIKCLSYASLEPRALTIPDKLSGEQYIIIFNTGSGILKAGNTTVDLREGIMALLPPDLEFTIQNTGAEPLTMYIITEPIPDGFTPKQELVVKDEKTAPLGGTTGHWTHITKSGFRSDDGLAVLTGLCPVWYDAMTMGQPHSHGPETEEIWFALKGDIHILLGKQFRELPVGSAYKIPPNGKTPHSNINAGDKPIKLFWMMKNVPYETIPYANLDPKPFDPATEPNIDMFMGSYKESPQYHTHGTLLERDVLTKCEGDIMNPEARGAVLRYVNRFTYATLMGHNSTLPSTPKGEQELYYVVSGTGTVTGGGKTHDIYPGVTFLIPENLEFTMKNTGSEVLEMYLVVEPTPDGFRPNDYIYINDEASRQTYTSTSHWVNVWEHLIEPEDGLAELELVLSVWVYPNSFAQPHSHNATTEEVWATIEGDVKFLMGKQIRDLPPGMAYLIPPDDATPHANFNISDKPIKFFYFARFSDHEPRK